MPSHNLSAVMKVRWADPAYRARQVELRRREWNDETIRAKRIESIRKVWTHDRRKLPPLTIAEMLCYEKLRKHGVDRITALKAIHENYPRA